MTDAAEQTTVTREDDANRYELHVGDVLAGFAQFRVNARGHVLFVHTEVDPAFSGRGLASILVGEAMADEAKRGETVVPHCPFVTKFLRTHDVPGLDVLWPDEPHPE